MTYLLSRRLFSAVNTKLDPRLAKFCKNTKTQIGTGYLHANNMRMKLCVQFDSSDIVVKASYNCFSKSDIDTLQMIAGAVSWSMGRTLGETILVNNNDITDHLKNIYNIKVDNPLRVDSVIREAAKNYLENS